MGNPKITIIVLNWNNFEDTKECLLSLRHLNYPRFNVVLVDNGSTDESGQKLAKEFPEVTYIETGKNLGYTGGNNVGIRYALENGADIVFVLNNDTVVGHHDLLIYISIAMYTEEKIGVVGPLIYDYFDKQQRVDINESMFYKISDRLCLKTDKNIRTIKDNITIKPVVCVAGCAIAFSRELLEKVGLFDETFFMYCEEIDLCFRAIMSGYKVVKIEDEKAKIFHKKSKLYYTPPYVWYYITRNMIKVINKNFSNLKWFLLFCFNIAAVLYRTLKLLLNDDLEGAMACLLGLYDGLLGRSGPKLS